MRISKRKEYEFPRLYKVSLTSRPQSDPPSDLFPSLYIGFSPCDKSDRGVSVVIISSTVHYIRSHLRVETSNGPK